MNKRFDLGTLIRQETGTVFIDRHGKGARKNNVQHFDNKYSGVVDNWNIASGHKFSQ